MVVHGFGKQQAVKAFHNAFNRFRDAYDGSLFACR